MNAVTQNGIAAVALCRSEVDRKNFTFSDLIDFPDATNQERSGRCWLFSGLSLLAQKAMKKLKLTPSSFEIYHMFWDNLEKANYFLENVIETARTCIFIMSRPESHLMESLTHIFALKTLLILLREARTMNVEEVAHEMRESHGGIVHAIDELEVANLIESRNERMVPYNRDITLTPSGQRVAEKLKEIEGIIGWRGSGGVS